MACRPVVAFGIRFITGFLGFGSRPPSVSWGLMLNDALNAGLGALELYPWILVPMIPVILVVLAFSFVGDALRVALDPYS